MPGLVKTRVFFKIFPVVCFVMALGASPFLAGCDALPATGPSPTPTRTPRPTSTPVEAASAPATQTHEPGVAVSVAESTTVTAEDTPLPAHTPTPTLPPTSTPTLAPSSTPTPTPTSTPVPSPPPTDPPASTSTPSPTTPAAETQAAADAPAEGEDVCEPVPGEQYDLLWVGSPPTGIPAERNPDLNPGLLNYASTNAKKELVFYNGESDPKAPQLPGLFMDNRTAAISAVYQLHAWNAECNCPGDLLTEPEVTMVGLSTVPGELIRVPWSGYTIGSGYQVLVLYAAPDRITLKYTRDDDVVEGYTLHVGKICVDSNLLALYNSANEAGRGSLPALRAGQPLGRAAGEEILVAIRDNGMFLDPRSNKDWWQGR